MIVTVAAVITYLARMYVRLIVVRSVGLDDYFMTLAMALSVSGQGIVWGSVVNGAGRHLGDIPLQNLGAGLKLNFISQAVYLVAICVVKLAVGAMLLRIASVPIYKHITKSLMIFQAAWTLMCLLTLLLQCTDIRALWDPTIPMNCWGEYTLHGLSYSNVAVSIFTDLAFALFIPVPMLWNLNVNRRTRLSLVGALGLGTFACAASFVKIPSLVNYGKAGDWLWDSRDISIWTIIECNVGIVAANLPTLRHLFKSILGSTPGSGDGSRKTPVGSSYWRKKSEGSSGNSAVASRKDKATVLDEASSDRAFADTSYELGDRKFDGTHTTSTRVYGANEEALSSADSVLGEAATQREVQGIKRTTTTSIQYGVAGAK